MSGHDGNEKELVSQKAKLTKSIYDDLAKEALGIYGAHPPLDAEKNEIRLLSVHDSEDINAPISGELHLATLDDDYTALSYVWGDWHNRRPIRLNGFDTTVTAMFENVLKQLRMEKMAQDIWIDAICVNQTDNTEKGHQVQKMSDIYRYANLKTILWLGERENNSDEAMSLIANADQTFFDDYDPNVPSPALQAVQQLLKRPWWKRMWVIQETMLSPNPVVKCGADAVHFDKFVTFRNLYYNAEEADHERLRPLRNLWTECPSKPMLEYHYKDWVGGQLATWLLDVATFECLHLRDKVYALLGLISKGTKDQITVEYDSSVKSDRMVLLQATNLCFLETGLLPLQIQQAVFVPFLGFGFCPYPTTSSFCPPAEKWLFGGDREVKQRFMFSKDGEILFLHGLLVDKIDFVDRIGTEELPEVPVYKGDDVEMAADTRAKRLQATKEACLRWEKHVKSSKATAYLNLEGGHEDAFCRTIVGNRSYGKNGLGSGVKSIFDAWVGRGSSSDGDLSSNQAYSKIVKNYSNSVVTRCAKRAFVTTANGYFGLAPRDSKVGDIVCIVYSAEVPYIFREPEPENADAPGSFVGEAYVHGIMQGEYLETAKVDDFTGFWLK